MLVVTIYFGNLHPKHVDIPDKVLDVFANFAVVLAKVAKIFLPFASGKIAISPLYG